MGSEMESFINKLKLRGMRCREKNTAEKYLREHEVKMRSRKAYKASLYYFFTFLRKKEVKNETERWEITLKKWCSLWLSSTGRLCVVWCGWRETAQPEWPKITSPKEHQSPLLGPARSLFVSVSCCTVLQLFTTGCGHRCAMIEKPSDITCTLMILKKHHFALKLKPNPSYQNFLSTSHNLQNKLGDNWITGNNFHPKVPLVLQ